MPLLPCRHIKRLKCNIKYYRVKYLNLGMQDLIGASGGDPDTTGGPVHPSDGSTRVLQFPSPGRGDEEAPRQRQSDDQQQAAQQCTSSGKPEDCFDDEDVLLVDTGLGVAPAALLQPLVRVSGFKCSWICKHDDSLLLFTDE